jgi:hypothetical protein
MYLILRRLFKIKEIKPQKTSLLYLSADKENNKNKIYCDTFCLTIPTYDIPHYIKIDNVNTITTYYAQAFFSSSIFKLEWFILYYLFKNASLRFNENNIKKNNFLPGDKIVPGVFKVKNRKSGEILNDWNLFNNKISGQNWLSVNVDSNEQKVYFLLGSTIYGNNVSGIMTFFHKMYSRILLNMAVNKLLKKKI